MIMNERVKVFVLLGKKNERIYNKTKLYIE